MNKVRKFFKNLGPGLITGAADDDPSGIATYTQTGAQFGYGQLWTALFMLPFLIAIQESCARIGAVQGKGIAAIVKSHFSSKILYAIVMLVVFANIINIGADIGAMAAATQLLIPLQFGGLIFFYAFLILFLIIWIPYRTYSQILKWSTLALLAYPISVFLVKEPWKEIFFATFIPHFEFNFHFLFLITGVFGTTISPYLFFWQCSTEVEEVKQKNNHNKNGLSNVSKEYLNRIRFDNFVGMFFSEVCTWSIILVGASFLHAKGITNVKSAADAARALEPLIGGFAYAGYIAKLIFALGILGLGFVSVPVLAGSAAYAVSEAFDWNSGLNLKFRSAQFFYLVIIAITLSGLIINFIGIDPIKLLIISAVINGVVAVPLIFLIAQIAKSKKIMGKYRSGPLSQIFVALTFLGMALSSLAMLVSLVK